MGRVETAIILSGPTGTGPCYIDMSEIVADHGPIQGTPTVVFADTGSAVGTYATISSPEMNGSQRTVTVSGVDNVMAAGTLLSFIVTIDTNTPNTADIAVTYTALQDGETTRKTFYVALDQRRYIT